MKVVRSESRRALGTLSLTRLVARFDAVNAENVKTLGQDAVLLVCIATRASQLGLERKKNSKRGQESPLFTFDALNSSFNTSSADPETPNFL